MNRLLKLSCVLLIVSACGNGDSRSNGGASGTAGHGGGSSGSAGAKAGNGGTTAGGGAGAAGNAGTNGGAGSSAAGTTGGAGSGAAGTTGGAGSGAAGTTGGAGAGAAGTTGGAGTGGAGAGGQTAGCIAAQSPTFTKATTMAWDGETLAGGHSFQGSNADVTVTCEDAHSGTHSLRFDFSITDYANSGYAQAGWNWETTVNGSGANEFVFWAKVKSADNTSPGNNVGVYITSDGVEGAGSEHHNYSGGINVSGGGMPGLNAIAVDGFDDGNWHEVKISKSIWCQQFEHPDQDACGPQNFDPSKLVGMILTFIEFDHNLHFYVYVDDVGLN